MQTIELLEKLVAFPTVSARTNLPLIDFVRNFLAGIGVESLLVPDETGSKANLFATIGPTDKPGILLSGHSDVVPVEGQSWSTDPFCLTGRDGRLMARGSADMKGFVACTLRAFALAAKSRLKSPLHLALSHDEEIGCVGVRSLLNRLALSRVQPRLCIIGEPTSMAIALGHKGKIAARASCCGVEAHSALAPNALNAIHLASDFITRLRQRQIGLAAGGARDHAYDIPYTTLHAGIIHGGTALNIVPNRTIVDFEIRNVAQEDAGQILAAIMDDAAAIAAPHRSRFPSAAVCVEITNDYPGLDTAADSEAVRFVRGLLDHARITKVAFGTEGGLFQQRLGIPVVVCGPGSIDDAHKPDEFVTRDQLAACDRMMERLVATLA